MGGDERVPGIQSTGTWQETYNRDPRPVVLLHEGGPADGVRVETTAGHMSAVRWFCGERARRRRVVRLARYVLYGAVEVDVFRYTYTGLDELHGPSPGRKNSPAWSW